jgi:hypothetical protein
VIVSPMTTGSDRPCGTTGLLRGQRTTDRDGDQRCGYERFHPAIPSRSGRMSLQSCIDAEAPVQLGFGGIGEHRGKWVPPSVGRPLGATVPRWCARREPRPAEGRTARRPRSAGLVVRFEYRKRCSIAHSARPGTPIVRLAPLSVANCTRGGAPKRECAFRTPQRSQSHEGWCTETRVCVSHPPF